MEAYHVLLIEDEPEILEYNRKRLMAEGYQVSVAATLTAARQALANNKPDLVVLDIMLPDGSGVDFCRDLRAVTKAPVLFLTSLGESEQIVRGLRAGGDDYMVKPYKMEELLARIEAHLRRAALWKQETEEQFGPLQLDAANQRAYWAGQDLLLKPKEFQLLVCLLKNRNRYSTAAELYTAVWGLPILEDPRTIATHIYSLRKKLQKLAGDSIISIDSSRNRGYRLEYSQGGRYE